SLRARVDGNAAVPLNVRCSRKWAMPAWPPVSRREPACTYAATETDRAAGNRAEITRGPSASAVRSNIAGMVPEPEGPTGESSGRRRGRRPRSRDWRALLLGQEGADPVLQEEHGEGDRHHPH